MCASKLVKLSGGSVVREVSVLEVFRRYKELKPEGIAELNEPGKELARTIADRTEIFTRLQFKPVIPIARGNESREAVEARARRALEAAQKYSLVANSVKSEILMLPEILIMDCLAQN
jgi:hypothetical protein